MDLLVPQVRSVGPWKECGALFKWSTTNGEGEKLLDGLEILRMGIGRDCSFCTGTDKSNAGIVFQYFHIAVVVGVKTQLAQLENNARILNPCW